MHGSNRPANPPGTNAPATSTGRDPATGPLLLMCAAAWLAFGLVAGSVQYWTLTREGGLSWLETVWNPLLASVVWIGITALLLKVARRWPLWPLRSGPLVLHLVLSVTASFVLNLFWGLGAAALGWLGFPPAGVSLNGLFSATWTAGLQNLHYNAGAWWVLAVLVTLWDRARANPTASVPTPDQSTPANGSVTKRPERGRWAETLAVRTGQRTRVIPVSDIHWIEGAGDYARLHTASGSHLSGQRLKELERSLDPASFARVHRSSIVNLERVRELKHVSHGDYEAVLHDGTVVRISRSRRKTIERLLGKR